MARGWEPDSTLAREDRVALVARVRATILALMREIVPEEVDVERRLTEAPDDDIAHPEFFGWYFAVKEAAGAGDADAFIACVQGLPATFGRIGESRARARENEAFFGFEVDLEGVPARAVVARAEQTAFEMSGARATLGLPKWTAPQREMLRDALELLRREWPEMLRELAGQVSEVTVFDGVTALESFADFTRHGAVFLHVDDFDDVVRIAEFVAHEASHVRLNAIHGVTPLLVDDGKLFTTPLRRDPRPMLGAFHQLYVINRLHALYTRVVPTRPRYEERLAQLGRDLEEAWRLVGASAQVSSVGAEILASIGERVASRGAP